MVTYCKAEFPLFVLNIEKTLSKRTCVKSKVVLSLLSLSRLLHVCSQVMDSS